MLSFLKTKLSPSSEPENFIEKANEVTETLEWKELTFDLIRNIRDPEKPETLEELDVVQEDLIEVEEISESPGRFIIKIGFVPTVPHCSLATLIGLCIRTKLQQELPEGKFKIDISIKVVLLRYGNPLMLRFLTNFEVSNTVEHCKVAFKYF